jgi:hypothetical protein
MEIGWRASLARLCVCNANTELEIFYISSKQQHSQQANNSLKGRSRSVTVDANELFD